MTETTDQLSNEVRWSARLAVGGLFVASLSVTAAFLGLEIPDPLYWLAILLSFGGILGAAAYDSLRSDVRYGAGMISTVIGVLVVAYGIENGVLLATVTGVCVIVVGTIAIVADSRRVK